MPDAGFKERGIVKKPVCMLWIVLLCSVQVHAAIIAPSTVSTSLAASDASKAIGSLMVQTGDYLVVLAASNLGNSPEESSLVLSTKAGASLGAVQFSDNKGFGPGVFLWHVQIVNGGRIDLTIGNPGGALVSVAAYVVRATAGETVDLTVASASDNTGTATGITNSYVFSGTTTGLVFEALSTYAANGATPVQVVFDEVHSSSKRGVGQVSFSGEGTVDSGYALSGSNAKTVVHGIAFSTSSPAAPPPPIASPDRARLHPANTYNVLFIAIDDMRPLIDAYGETEPLKPITPNMDRLAEGGIMFANAHCQQAVCNASRASLLTGLRPDTTKCWKLSTFFRDQIPDVITLPQHFGANGYTVHGIGKIFHNIGAAGQDAALSWNGGWANSATAYEWYEPAKAVAEDGGNSKVSATDAGEVDRGGFPITDADYHDGNAAELGKARIATYAADFQATGTPFFLAVGFRKPHLPFNCPKSYWDLYDPLEIDLAGYTGIRSMPVGSNKFTAPYGTEPAAFDDVVGTSDGMPTEPEARHLIHGYLACVSFIDTQIGKLLDALEDPDGNPGTDDSIVDNTIVVLWGDHGFHLGDHNGFWAKHSNYELSTRVPLIVQTPGLADMGVAGSRSVALVELVDLYPTLLDLCSLPAPVQPSGLELQGTTFLPLLEDPAQPWKHAVYSQFQRWIGDGNPGDVPVGSTGDGMGYSIRTDRYRYTEWWVTESTDETDRHIIKAGITEPALIELYDYVADPNETTNLASQAAYSNLVVELSDLLGDSDPVSAGDGWKQASVDAPGSYPVDFPAWQAGYMAPGMPTSDMDLGSDPDNDLLRNALEYKMGTHPLEADSSAVSNIFGPGSVGLVYPYVTNRTDVALEVVETNNLSSNLWVVAGTVQTNVGVKGHAEMRMATLPATDDQCFIRLRATYAP